MLRIGSSVQKVGDHPDAGARGSRIVAVGRRWRSWVLKAQDRSGSIRCSAPVEVEGIARVKFYDWASDRADGLEDTIGIVSVVEHQQVAGIDGNARRTQSHAAWRCTKVDLGSIRRNCARRTGRAGDGLLIQRKSIVGIQDGNNVGCRTGSPIGARHHRTQTVAGLDGRKNNVASLVGRVGALEGQFQYRRRAVDRLADVAASSVNSVWDRNTAGGNTGSCLNEILDD